MAPTPRRRSERPKLLVGLLSAAALVLSCKSGGGGGTAAPDLSVCNGPVMSTLHAIPTSGGGGGGGGPGSTTLRIHYHRPDGDYAGWVLHAWNAARDPGWAVGYPQAGTDAFGVYFEPELLSGSGEVGYIIHKGDTKDLDADQSYTLKPGANEIWRISGDPVTYLSDPTTAGPKDLTTVRVHYQRFDGDYGAWGLHLFPSGGIDASRLPGLTLDTWSQPVPFASMPGYSAAADGSEVVFDVPVLNPKDDPARTGLSFVIHGMPTNPNGGVDNKDGRTSDIAVSYAAVAVTAQVAEVWIVQEDATVYAAVPDLRSASTTDARAYWLDEALLKWPKVNGAGTFKLYHSAIARIAAAKEAAVTGADGALTLQVHTGAIPAEAATRFKYVSAGVVLQVKDADLARLGTLHRSQLVLVQEDAAGKVQNATTAQVAGALDGLYAEANASARDLGATISGGSTKFKLWAPTARKVSLCTYGSGSGAATGLDEATFDAATGAWSVTKPAALAGTYYTYAVEVFVRGVGVVRNLVTDPYSVSLGTNSTRSYVADLGSASLKPAGWDAQGSPPRTAAQTDMVIYELHVRDFSINDPTVSAANRGKYRAFTEAGSNGMKHLAAIAAAGVTDVHLLPVFDIATVEEDAAQRVDLDTPFSTLCARNPAIAGSVCSQFATETVRQVLQSYQSTFGPAGEQQQQVVGWMRELDGFNWGYDPFHYTAPEGSYASDASDGARRILEFREMVMGLRGAGLRVGMDVVYNHTTAAGQNAKSVLDRVVPGYYHRLNATGNVETSTCCSNTATENAMMAKLMSDSVVTWATQYGIDSFRFDLMGHQPRAAMEALKARLRTETGRDVYLIGEGWNFGEVVNGTRFVQASQLSLNGSGIGTFSDRARDRIRGGSPFDSGASLVSRQGFVSGLSYDPNPSGPTGAEALTSLKEAGDMVKLGLAGSLRDYALVTADGTPRLLQEIRYGSDDAGYVTQPAEVVNYVENHDNETLFDINAYKLPTGTSEDDRVRVQMLGVALNAFSQGVAYFHAGVDTLRSKSMDRNSYNSGDWFNALDWSYASNNFGVGAPPEGDNSASWAQSKPLLRNASIKPSPAAIARARDMFRDLLAIRASSTLFRMRTAEDVKTRLAFHNTGPDQVPSVVIGHLDGAGYAGAGFAEILYLVNVDKVAHVLTIDAEKGKAYVLHPVQAAAAAADPRPAADAAYAPDTGTFTVPPRTAVVYVVP
jgi:pullulanase-type alpha-1,6-glucosidase